MDFQAQLDDLKKQAKEDFQFTMIALGDVVDKIKQVQGKMARKEERFEMMVEIVQNALKASSDQQKTDMDELRARVERLERERPSAA